MYLKERRSFLLSGRTIVDPFDIERFGFDFHKQKPYYFGLVNPTKLENYEKSACDIHFEFARCKGSIFPNMLYKFVKSFNHYNIPFSFSS